MHIGNDGDGTGIPLYRFYKGSALNKTSTARIGSNGVTDTMTGLTTGATNACTVRAIDRVGNESEPYPVNIPTKEYIWDIYTIGITLQPESEYRNVSVLVAKEAHVMATNATTIVDNIHYESFLWYPGDIKDGSNLPNKIKMKDGSTRSDNMVELRGKWILGVWHYSSLDGGRNVNASLMTQRLLEGEISGDLVLAYVDDEAEPTTYQYYTAVNVKYPRGVKWGAMPVSKAWRVTKNTQSTNGEKTDEQAKSYTKSSYPTNGEKDDKWYILTNPD